MAYGNARERRKVGRGRAALSERASDKRHRQAARRRTSWQGRLVLAQLANSARSPDTSGPSPKALDHRFELLQHARHRVAGSSWTRLLLAEEGVAQQVVSGRAR